jgi:hypothetical protein
MLDDLQRRGAIEKSDSPWPSPVVLVTKKNGELYNCVDYRNLNGVTKKGCFPLPRIDTLVIKAFVRFIHKIRSVAYKFRAWNHTV